jgi:hypothetical protein
MAGSFIDRTDPMFDDLGRCEVINVRCKCGREVQIAPYQLIGKYGIQKHTKVWGLRDRFRCWGSRSAAGEWSNAQSKRRCATLHRLRNGFAQGGAA